LFEDVRIGLGVCCPAVQKGQLHGVISATAVVKYCHHHRRRV